MAPKHSTTAEQKQAERAELIQAVQALYIPASLFLACVIMAAGTFLVYNGEQIGWMFAAVSALIILSAFVALLRFQNKLRVRGILPPEEDDDVTPQT